MTSLYEAVFGRRQECTTLVTILAIEGDWLQKSLEETYGRLRDAWIERTEDGDLEIRVHTRNGGPNRPDYEAAWINMRAHPWYVRDADSDHDSTYSDTYFKIPPDRRQRMPTLEQLARDRVDIGGAWREAIEAMEKMTPEELSKLMDRVSAATTVINMATGEHATLNELADQGHEIANVQVMNDEQRQQLRELRADE